MRWQSEFVADRSLDIGSFVAQRRLCDDDNGDAIFRCPSVEHERALGDLRYIRSTVENAREFTAVSGRDGVLDRMEALIHTMRG